jgi:hypothetical protein
LHGQKDILNLFKDGDEIILEFKTSDGSSLDIEKVDEMLVLTDGDFDSVMIPLADLPRLIHELQIIANEYPSKKA